VETLKAEIKKQENRTQAMPQPGMVDYMAGEQKDFTSDLEPYLPVDLIGGSVPYIPGHEEEAVWNAASQACGTEKVHFTYTVEENRCWYLACPSASLASNPDSWCPLAAALPGNSEYWDRETVYLYEKDGMASALKWDKDTGRIQVFIGASRTLLPRIQSMDANFVTVNPEMADIVPWRNRSLMSEKLSRAASRLLLLSGLIVTFGLGAFLFYQYTATALVDRNLKKVQAETDRASQKLMMDAYGALQNDTARHMVRMQQLLDELRQIDGTLVKYEVTNGKAVWEALVPRGFQQGVGTIRGQLQPGIEPDGRIRIKGAD